MKNDSRDISLQEQIDAYIKGHLSEQEVNELWVELLKEPEYISLLQTEIDVARIYESRKNDQSVLPRYWKWIGVAAAMVLLVVSVNFFSRDAQKSIQQWTQGSINIADNLSTARVTRSATAISPSDSLLNAGFKAAMKGDMQGAMDIYKGILKQYESPDIQSKAYLNLGILEYNAGHFEKSIAHFRQAIQKGDRLPLLKERAYWYLGNAYVNTHQLDKARQAVQKAYSSGKLYKSEAFRLLKRLDYKLGNIDFDDFDTQVNNPDK